MKVIILVISIVFVFFLYLPILQAKEDIKETERTVLTITLEERRELLPDILSFNLSVSAKSEKEAEVINMLGLVDRALRELNLEYSGGSYSVYKNCWWEKDRRKCSGYKGEVVYQFKLKEAKEQNRVLETVDEIKEKYGEKLHYNVSYPQWSISEKRIRQAEGELKLTIIDSAKAFANKVTSKIERNCTISEINYDIRRPYFDQQMILKAAPMREVQAIEAPEPKREERAVAVKAQIKLICIEHKR